MPIDTGVPGLRIASYMNLEQAMGEVRNYLEVRSRPLTVPVEGDRLALGQLSLQGAFIARLSDIATRLGQVEPNSKLGPPGVFLKRVVRKLIGWYSRPIHEFNRTSLENFQQIRQDMLRLQQQVSALNDKIVDGLAERPLAASNLSLSSADTFEADQSALLRVTLGLFKDLMAVRAVRQALEIEDIELLRRAESFLNTVERDLRATPRTPGPDVRT